jgi:hypothetical protein
MTIVFLTEEQKLGIFSALINKQANGTFKLKTKCNIIKLHYLNNIIKIGFFFLQWLEGMGGGVILSFILTFI